MTLFLKFMIAPWIQLYLPFGQDLLGVFLLKDLVRDGFKEVTFFPLALSSILYVDLHILYLGNEYIILNKFDYFDYLNYLYFDESFIGGFLSFRSIIELLLLPLRRLASFGLVRFAFTRELYGGWDHLLTSKGFIWRQSIPLASLSIFRFPSRNWYGLQVRGRF